MGTYYNPAYQEVAKTIRRIDRQIKRDISKYRRIAAIRLLAAHPLDLTQEEQQHALKALPFWGDSQDLPTAVDRTARAVVEMRGQLALFAGVGDVQ